MRTIRNLGGGETKLSWMGQSDGVAVIHPLFMPRGPASSRWVPAFLHSAAQSVLLGSASLLRGCVLRRRTTATHRA